MTRDSLIHNLIVRASSFCRPFTILCYHEVSQGSDPPSYCEPEVVVSVQSLRRQLQLLTKLFEVVTLRDLQKTLHQRGPRARPLLVLTFDDSYESVFTHTAPLLEQQGVRATIFVSTSVVDCKRVLWPEVIYMLVRYTPLVQLIEAWQDNFKEPRVQRAIRLVTNPRRPVQLLEFLKRLPASQVLEATQNLWKELSRFIPEDARPRYLNAHQISALHQAGFEIGGHSLNHPILTQASEETVQREIGDDKKQLEEIVGQPLVSFAYPNGNYNGVVQRVVAQQGYRWAVTLDGRLRSNEPTDWLALERIEQR